MPQHRKPYSANRSRRTSRQVSDATIGTHVARTPQARPHATARGQVVGGRSPSSVRAVARRARARRAIVAIVIALGVVSLAVAAGWLAFRGTVGSAFSLRGSDAQQALSAPRAGQAAYVLVTAELGAVAEPLEGAGPDVIALARLDEANRTLALVSLPASLQVTTDNTSRGLAEMAADQGDAALVNAVETLAKVDIAHIVKLDEQGVVGITDALGGIAIDLEQVIDDPHAGSVYLEEGPQVLDGQGALVYLRATNVRYGAEDRLSHQLTFMSKVIEGVFSREGGFTARLESLGGFFQTDYSLADLESLDGWLAGISAQDITCAIAPGYFTAVTNVTGGQGERFVSSSADMAALIDDLENGREPSTAVSDDTATAPPAGFTVDVRNGTTVEGAASAAAAVLMQAGFTVGDVGNAEQPVYDETIVVYKDGDEGLARANAVIKALGVGRPVESSAYYDFAHDVLLVVGADNKPVS